MSEGRYVLFYGRTSSLFLFIYCLCLSVTIVLSDHLYIKLIQFAFFLLLVMLTRKKKYCIGALIVFLFTMMLNAVVIEGKVLFHVFGYPITEGALTTGVQRGFNLVTLFYMSKSFIDASLIFQGRIGAFLGKVFLYFDFFTNHTHLINVKTACRDIDRLLIVSEYSTRPVTHKKLPSSCSLRTFFLYATVLFGNIILLILNYGFFKQDNR